MRDNRLAWFAIVFAIAALINSIVVGYFGLHSHDVLDANDTITEIPFHNWDFSGGTNLNRIVRDDTVHSEAYGSYPAEVPFEQGMTLFPGQLATMTLGLDFSDTTYAEVMTEATLKLFKKLLLESTTTIDSIK